MQSIERYGIVALLFLVATFTAVLVMTEDPVEAGAQDPHVAGASQNADQAPVQGGGRKSMSPSEARSTNAPRLKMQSVASSTQKRGLGRADFAALRADELEAERAARRAREQEQERTAAMRAARVNAAGPSAGFAPAIATPIARGREPRAAATLESARPATTPARTARARSTSRVAGNVYVVRSGDTLGEISQRQLGTFKLWRRIVEANPGLDPAKLKVGQELRMPASTAAGAAPVASSAAAATSGTYKVRSGDSLWKIAKRTLGDGERYREIIAMNPGIDPNNVKVGQKLSLPAGAGTTSVASTSRPRRSAAIVSSVSSKRSTRTTGRVR